jgi:RND family efflux transporter MFP subunit
VTKRALCTRLVGIALLALTGACKDHDHAHEPGHGEASEHGSADPEDPHGHEEHAEATTAITTYGASTEVFVELPPLVVGEPVEPAILVTRLDDFRPLREGAVTLELTGGGAPAERFDAGAPVEPGIFRLQISAAHAGRRTATVRVAWEGAEDLHALGELDVFTDDAAAHAAEAPSDEAGGAISFLKEQQWRVDFATVPVELRRIRPTVEAYGTLRPRSDGEALVVAPVRGRLQVGAGFPKIGDDLDLGEAILQLVPDVAETGDLAALEQDVAMARIAVASASSERERVVGLAAEGAVAGRRVAEARFRLDEAQEALKTAKRRLAQGRAALGAEGQGPSVAPVAAPIRGTVISVEVTPGQVVDAGQPLVRLVDLTRLWIEVHVAETHVAELSEPRGLWFEVDGYPEVFELGPESIVAVGGAVDVHSRTLPLIAEVPNADRRLRSGMFAVVHVVREDPHMAPAVPLSALVFEAGVATVYVQRSGETFERRVVRVGVRDGLWTEVLEGVEVGERVVSDGAYLVRLASAKVAVPAHAH